MAKIEEGRQLTIGDRLYDQYAKPLEAEHWGEFIAIHPEDGRTLMDADDRELSRKIVETFGRGSGCYVFKIGPRVVGRFGWGGAKPVSDAEGERRRSEADRLYERYGKPLEPEYAGQYIAISPSGGTLRGETLHEVAERAEEALGRGHYVFKLGEDRAVGRWR